MTAELVPIGELALAVDRSVSWLRRQADRGNIPSVRTAGGHRRFNVADVREALATQLDGPSRLGIRAVQPAARPDWHRRLALANLEEDVVWRSIADDLMIDGSTPADRITQYAFTEMLNNAIDHSGGAHVDIAVWLTPDVMAFRISDNGEGVFQHLQTRLGLPDHLAAIQELTKGKRTTMADRHSGEGIFFTSKSVDLFQLSSAGLRWTVDNLRDDHAVGIARADQGTTVVVQVSRQTKRELSDIFAKYTEDHEFVRTRPVVRLFALGQTFVSRSEAKRVAAGLGEFTEVEVDFRGVTDVGQGFVDELFRVWPSHHEGKRLVPVNMNPAVEFMVKRATASFRAGDE